MYCGGRALEVRDGAFSARGDISECSSGGEESSSPLRARRIGASISVRNPHYSDSDATSLSLHARTPSVAALTMEAETFGNLTPNVFVTPGVLPAGQQRLSATEAAAARAVVVR